MRIAVVYNHDSNNVINLFGVPNRERIGLQTIKRITDALKTGEYQVRPIEADKNLIEKIEDFMPRVLKGEQPGLVFNISYGIQGQARYTHTPSILEMVGIPYVGSGPLAHGLALDKVVAKTIFRQKNLPTPDFVVLDSWRNVKCDLAFPLIVKPKNESVSFGVRIVRNNSQLRKAVQTIIEEYQQPVLVEQYIEGREINVGLIGNSSPEPFPPVELFFGKKGPPIYTYEDKIGQSGRKITYKCPAVLDRKKAAEAKQLAQKAFEALGCYDYARIDMRLDKRGKFYILEVNSLPSLGQRGSYLIGVENTGLDFKAVINRLVQVASARYFGTPKPREIDFKSTDPASGVFSFLTQRRGQIERRIETWTNFSSRTFDSLGMHEFLNKVSNSLEKIGLKPVRDFTYEPFAKTWQTKAGFTNGTLLIGHLDIPLDGQMPPQGFHRDPEWLYGEGVGLSRAPLVMVEFVLRALKYNRYLLYLPLGVLYYTDEGYGCKYSERTIRAAALKAKQVLVLRPGNLGNKVVTQRRGQRKYVLTVETDPRRLGKTNITPEALRWVSAKIEELAKLSSRKDRIAIGVSELKTTHFPMLLPHRVVATLLLRYGDEKRAEITEKKMWKILKEKGIKSQIEKISDRPPMKLTGQNQRLAKALKRIAEKWDIPLEQESSLWPTVAGLVPKSTAAVCGVGPVAKELYTPREAVQRISVLQRTLLLAEFLIEQCK